MATHFCIVDEIICYLSNKQCITGDNVALPNPMKLFRHLKLFRMNQKQGIMVVNLSLGIECPCFYVSLHGWGFVFQLLNQFPEKVHVCT